MWFLVLVQLMGTRPEVSAIGVFQDHENCIVVLHEIEFGIQGTHQGLICLEVQPADSI